MNGITVSTRQNSIPVTIAPEQPVRITVPTGLPGPPGPPGAAAQWDSMTQAEYNALVSKDPNTLYVIVP